MQIQLIRNASLKIQIADRIILVDPMLGAKGSFMSFAGVEENPTVDLPFPAEEFIQEIDFILLTHTHIDHWDPEAIRLLDKDIPVFCQPEDLEKIESQGFSRVTSIDEHTKFEGIDIIRTKAQHGTGEVLELMGPVSGYILDNPEEPTVYIIGDSVLTEEVKNTCEEYQPEIVIANSGGAYMPDYPANAILMDAAETALLADFIYPYLLICVHSEALDHCTVTREELELIAMANKNRNMYIPQDGDIMDFQ